MSALLLIEPTIHCSALIVKNAQRPLPIMKFPLDLHSNLLLSVSDLWSSIMWEGKKKPFPHTLWHLKQNICSWVELSVCTFTIIFIFLFLPEPQRWGSRRVEWYEVCLSIWRKRKCLYSSHWFHLDEISLQNVTPFAIQALRKTIYFYFLRSVPMQISRVFCFLQHLPPSLGLKEPWWLSA